MTPSPRRGLPPASVPLRKGRAVPTLQEGGRLRPLRLKGGGPLRAAGVLVVSLNGTVAGPTLTAANAGGRDALPGAAANIRGLLIGDKGFILPQLRADLGGGGSGCKRPCARTWPTRGIPASHGCR